MIFTATPPTYNLFISHAWKYSEHYYKVIEWLNEAKEEGKLLYKNYSVPQHDPLIDPDSNSGKSVLKKSLVNQITPASKIIILSGMYVAHSDWIDFEIDTAVEKDKYIIGLRPWGQQLIPTKVSNNASKMVGWNKKSLIDALLES